MNLIIKEQITELNEITIEHTWKRCERENAGIKMLDARDKCQTEKGRGPSRDDKITEIK